MKKITIEQVKQQIVDYAPEFEENTVDYYLHITAEGDIVYGYSKADETLVYSVPYERYGLQIEDISAENNQEKQEKDLIYSHEVDGDEIFEEIAKNLCDQANKWLEEQGE